MGHTRLGKIPTSKKWRTVIATISSGAVSTGGVSPTLANEVSSVSRQALEAAEAGLKQAIADRGLNYVFYLLTQVALASRQDNLEARLTQHGISLKEEAKLFDLISEFQNSIDDHIFEQDCQTDISEMAQKAAGEALTVLASPTSTTLFGEDQDSVKASLRQFSTTKGFGHLSQKFFGLFMARFLNFYVSRITAKHMGNEKLQQLGDLTEFNRALRRHCEESARIVQSFAGEWYSKTEYQQGIDQENTSGFLAVALKKLQAELARQREE